MRRRSDNIIDQVYPDHAQRVRNGLILEALQTDRDIYLQSARDAVADGSHDLAAAFGNAAERIRAFRVRVRREFSGQSVRQ